MPVVCLNIPGAGRTRLVLARLLWTGTRGPGASACGFGSCTGLYVAVRGIGGTGARAHVHIADSVPAVGVMKCRFRRSGAIWRCRQVAVCKTVGSAYVGSNPTPATTCENGPLAAETRPGGPFLLCPSVCHLVAL